MAALRQHTQKTKQNKKKKLPKPFGGCSSSPLAGCVKNQTEHTRRSLSVAPDLHLQRQTHSRRGKGRQRAGGSQMHLLVCQQLGCVCVIRRVTNRRVVLKLGSHRVCNIRLFQESRLHFVTGAAKRQTKAITPPLALG